MKKWQNVLVGASLFASFSLMASEQVTTSLYRVIEPNVVEGFYDYELQSIEDRTTYYLGASESALVDAAKMAMNNGQKVQITFDTDRQVTNIDILDVEAIGLRDLGAEELPGDDKMLGAEPFSYQPTNYTTEREALNLFDSLRRLDDKSQCYQRAHVWSKSLWDNFGTRSMKVFIFFTSRYQKNYRYKWWFHVSPYVLVNGKERVLDYQFTSTALPMKDWSDEFIATKAQCPKMQNYSDLQTYAYSEDCLLAYVPMYFYQPYDIENYARNGNYKANWSSYDVKHSRRALNCPWLGRCF